MHFFDLCLKCIKKSQGIQLVVGAYIDVIIPDLFMKGKPFQCQEVLLSLRVLFVPVLLLLRDNQGSIIEIVYVYTFNGSISLHAEELARKLCSFVFQYYKILVFFIMMKFKHTSLLKLCKVCLTSFALW